MSTSYTPPTEENDAPVENGIWVMLKSTWEKTKTNPFNPDASEVAEQCCFLCLRGREGSYAVQVPCVRSTQLPHLFKQTLQKNRSEDGRIRLKAVSRSRIDESFSHKKDAFESDAAIWQKIREAYFHNQGTWKQWLPFYGPTTVQEVKFQFVGIKTPYGRFPISDVTSVDPQEVRERMERIIASAPDSYDQTLGNVCFGDGHSSDCPMSTPFGEECILDMVGAARQRRRKLDMLHLLKDCAKDPQSANGLRTLEGMGQETCIYELGGHHRVITPRHNKPYHETGRVRGIEMAMGWQFDRMARELPIRFCWTVFSLSVIWVCVASAGLKGDWNIAIAFGQLLAASVALVFQYAKE